MVFTVVKIEENSRFEHKGDVIIEGNIGKNARIKITDGNLQVDGDIEEGVEVELVSTPETKTSGAVHQQVFYAQHELQVKGSIGNQVSITGQGMITVNDIGEHVIIHSMCGSIRTRNIGSLSTLETMSGHIVAANVGGNCHLSSMAGHITAQHVDSHSVLSTMSGHVRANNTEKQVILKTMSGTITENGVKRPSALKKSNVTYSQQTRLFGKGIKVDKDESRQLNIASAQFVLSGLGLFIGVVTSILGLAIPGCMILLIPGVIGLVIGLIGIIDSTCISSKQDQTVARISAA